MKKPFRAVFGFLILALIGFVGWNWWARQPVGGSEKRVRFTIPSGATVAVAGRLLERDGLIRSALYFSRFAGGNRASIHAGVYEIAPTERPATILRRLTKGDVATIRATFPEGFTVAQVAHRLHRLGLVADENTFLTLVTERGNTLKATFALPPNLEGYLFPDTYRFPVGATDEEIAQKMVSEFDRRVAEGKLGDIEAAKRPLADIVNVAAMIEREAETDDDRPRIAGVIYNRLARRMRLEMDATVQYARGVHKTRLMNRDLTIDSPYNTYRVFGLPAGPICNPGLPSIEAALHPAKSDYLFYVAGPDGKAHVFARTLAEHQRNVAIYRKTAAAATKAAAKP